MQIQHFGSDLQPLQGQQSMHDATAANPCDLLPDRPDRNRKRRNQTCHAWEKYSVEHRIMYLNVASRLDPDMFLWRFGSGFGSLKIYCHKSKSRQMLFLSFARRFYIVDY